MTQVPLDRQSSSQDRPPKTQTTSFSQWVDRAAILTFVLSSLCLSAQWYFGQISWTLAALTMPAVYLPHVCIAVLSTLCVIVYAYYFSSEASGPTPNLAKQRYNALFKKRHFARVNNYWGYIITAVLFAGILGGGFVGVFTGSQSLVFVSAFISRPAAYAFLLFMSLVWATIYGKPVLAMVRGRFIDQEDQVVLKIHNAAVDKFNQTDVKEPNAKAKLKRWIETVYQTFIEKKQNWSIEDDWNTFRTRYNRFTGIAFVSDAKQFVESLGRSAPASDKKKWSDAERKESDATQATTSTSHKDTWAKWPVRAIGFLNGFVNGTGTLFAAIGVCDFAFGHAAVLMWPLWLKGFVLGVGFLSGACAAWALTWVGIEEFADRILNNLGYIQKENEDNNSNSFSKSKASKNTGDISEQQNENDKIPTKVIAGWAIVTVITFAVGFMYSLWSMPAFLGMAAALVCSVPLYGLYNMFSQKNIDAFMVNNGVAMFFALLTAGGMACFQYHTGATMLPNIFEWLGIVTSGTWLSTLSMAIGGFCALITVVAAAGFFTKFCMQPIQDFYRDGRAQGWVAWGFSKALVLVPTIATVTMLVKSTYAFSWFASFPGVAAFIMGICCVYLMGKMFMENAATWYDLATLSLYGQHDSVNHETAELFNPNIMDPDSMPLTTVDNAAEAGVAQACTS